MARHVVCRVDELPPGGRRIVEVRGRQIGVYNVGGAYYALLNRCPHRAAPLCLGPITGLISSPEQYKVEMTRDGEIVRCPWHGWEFDITTGQSVFNPHRIRARSYEVTVEAPDASLDDAEWVASGSDGDGSNAAGRAATLTRTVGPDDEDPSIETFEVSVEQEVVVLHLGQSRPARRPA